MAHHLYPHLHFHGVDDASYYELNVVDVDPPLLQPPPPPLPPLPPPRPHEREAAASGVPQWSHAETAEFLAARAELDRSFAAAKRNKPLWEAVSARLRLKGFARTPDQCKSKWKNLLTRFKVYIIDILYMYTQIYARLATSCRVISVLFFVFLMKKQTKNVCRVARPWSRRARGSSPSTRR